jgi:glycosyltransferase involved in cell wall biosynthesis
MNTDTRPLRILHSESSLGWGGQENRILNEMFALREMGHEISVLTQPGAKLAVRAREAAFPVFETRMRNLLDFRSLLTIRRVIRETRADIVNTHSGRDTQLVGIAVRSIFADRPRIVRTRHLALPITSRFTYSVLPDHVVTVSAYVADYLVSAGIQRSQITTVLTGVDLSRYRADIPGTPLREELGLPTNALLIGTVAILRRKKGHSELLEAIPAVLDRFPDAHFVFAGNGPQQQNLEKRIAELGLTQHVHLLGLRRDVINVLRALDLFVLPTHQEALGTVFVEAGAMGLATVATRVDGIPEVVVDGVTGLLVPALETSPLAEAIMALLADPARRKSMGEAARQHVITRFSREMMGKGMINVYRKLLDQSCNRV